MSNKVWAYIDQFKGQALPTSWECLTAGRQLAEKLGGGVTAVVIGSQVSGLAVEAFQYGAAEVLAADDPALAEYIPEPFTSTLSKAAGELQPEVIILPTTIRGRELAAMLAVDLKTGVMPDAIALEVENGAVTVTRPVYAGKLLARTVCKSKPQVITVRVRAFARPQPDASRSGTLTPIPAVGISAVVSRVVSYSQAEGGVSLGDANIIVSGGRGVANNPALQPPAGMDEKQAEIWRAQQGFKLVGALANTLGGALGASRAAVDAGYIPYSHQVGQTGKVVSPNLYIACGISGAIQHLAGMRTSKMIVAINKDPEAPIFKLARYGVVGDLYQIVPALTEAFKKRLGR